MVIVVPNSIELLTPCVIQLDFFEDELRFVRGLPQTGQKVIDIGANYGVYTREFGPRGTSLNFYKSEQKRAEDDLRPDRQGGDCRYGDSHHFAGHQVSEGRVSPLNDCI
jgi:hypothetical protein